MFSTERHISRRDLGWYTLVFAVCAAGVCVVVPLSGHSFVQTGDAWMQHIQSFAYYGMWLRDLVSSLIRGDGVPAFGLSIGYGTDVVGSLHYEVVGDPLALLSIFVPAAHAHILYQVLIFVRLYLAGLAFMAFTRHTVSCSRTALLIGAATYVFCGYTLHAIVTHSFFLNPIICLPLVLLGLELLLAGRGPLPFIAAVALSCIANFYFAYMIALAVLVYLAWRLSCRFNMRHLRGTAADLGRAVGAGALGILVSACVFLPAVVFFSQGARQGMSVTLDPLYSFGYYANLPAAFLSSSVSPGNSALVAVGPVFVLALVSLFDKRCRADREVKVLACMLIAFLLFPVCAYVFNGFSKPLNRWVWVFAFFAAWLVSRQWDAIAAAVRTGARGMYIALACVYALAIALLFWACGFEFSETRIRQVCLLVLSFALSLCMLFALSRCAKSRFGRSSFWRRCAVCLCLLAIVVNGTAYFACNREGYFTFDALAQRVEENPYAKLADTIESEGESGGFARASCRSHLNEQVTEGISTVGYYWSLAQGELARYWSELSIVPRSAGGGFTRFNDLDGRSTLNELSGVRYFLAKDDEALPAGAEKVEEDFSGNLDLYEDAQALPFGYTYSCELDESWYAQASAVDREQGMLEGVLVEDAGGGENGGDGDDESADLPEAQIETTSREVSYEISCSEGVSWDGASFTVKKADAQAVLSFAGNADAETYVRMDGLWVESVGADSDISIGFSAGTSDKFKYFTPSHQYYYDQHDFLFNGGYSEAPQTSATITFSKKGVYSIESLRVVCQPLSGQAEKLDALRADSLRDVDFHKAGDSASTNFITGRIEVHDVRKFLLVNLPYSDGWTAKVDGREVALYRANTMFMGLYLDPGEHEIELSYATPGAHAGLAASAVGAAGTALWCAISRRKEDGDADKPACATCRA